MRVLWATFLIVVVDQVSKLVVHANMTYGDSIPIVGELFRFTYTQNPGMAFGLTVGSKLFLTLFSILATVLIFLYLRHVRWAPLGYRTALALVLGGALGNVIDRVFYGVAFGECPPTAGNARLFYGCVVDFLHVDVGTLRIPEAVPGIGGAGYPLFPIGNVADVSIIAGVVLILVTQGAFHRVAAARERALHEAPAPEAVPVAPTVEGGGPPEP